MPKRNYQVIKVKVVIQFSALLLLGISMWLLSWLAIISLPKEDSDFSCLKYTSFISSQSCKRKINVEFKCQESRNTSIRYLDILANKNSYKHEMFLSITYIFKCLIWTLLW